MMSTRRDELLLTLDAIVVLLRNADEGKRAAWLVARRDELDSLDPADADGDAKIRAELRRIVPGMGGLTDLGLDRTPDSRNARADLDELTEKLHELTQPTESV